MATIKAIEAKSVHQIQSGQVIVDLCSVVKELVENSLDAGTSSLEVRFKNYGLDSIEIQDNGSGIAAANYESVSLKHHTSKLSSYDDLSQLHTFGFRGEALSSLCALSTFYIVTAQADEAPKGHRLDFETSGKLRSTSIVASQKGTTAVVENLFEQLPVRRKELTKNIKREYGKVIGLLHAYACICTNIKFSVKNSMPKGKSMTVFATNSNATTKENIANVYGAKTLSALVAVDLELDLQSTLTQLSRSDSDNTMIHVQGHISKPVFGEGRQTPDRQMFFVNGRPCGLPQIAKAINEAYKSFNVSQSPFVFADFKMDTNAYDVNVSPDKRTILLHNAVALTEKLKSALIALFENQDHTVPQTQVQTSKLPAFKQLSIPSETTAKGLRSATASRQIADERDTFVSPSESEEGMTVNRVLHDHFRNQACTRDDVEEVSTEITKARLEKERARRAEKLAKVLDDQARDSEDGGESDGSDKVEHHQQHDREAQEMSAEDIRVRDFNERLAERKETRYHQDHTLGETSTVADDSTGLSSQTSNAEQSGVVQNAFDRMRARRTEAELATITIGDQTTTTIIGNRYHRHDVNSQKEKQHPTKSDLRLDSTRTPASQLFSQRIRNFGAPGTQIANATSDDEDEIEVSEGESDNSTSDSEHIPSPTVPSLGAREKIPLRLVSQIEASNSEEFSSDSDYVDEAEKKADEDAKVADLIRAAEESAAIPTEENLKRANRVLKNGGSKDSTLKLEVSISFDPAELEDQIDSTRRGFSLGGEEKNGGEIDGDVTATSEEERLSLTISKDDFSQMHVVGQFNLGFILAVRPAMDRSIEMGRSHRRADELFIIDQHASDEKYNFERLQAETIVGTQRLVRPGILDLTAVEEEIVLDNVLALEKNGFLVDIDTSGDRPVGQRCRLTSLPLSKEVVFDYRDLEELIHLLAEAPTLNADSIVPRPTKVRKMFAMRACRCSIMIGKTLSRRQMTTVLTHMGTIDKPWNCPHGRPTMRHLTSLTAFDPWQEGDGVVGLEEEEEEEEGARGQAREAWRRYLG